MYVPWIYLPPIFTPQTDICTSICARISLQCLQSWNIGRWLPLPKSSSAEGFFLLTGFFFFPPSLSDCSKGSSNCWSFLYIIQRSFFFHINKFALFNLRNIIRTVTSFQCSLPDIHTLMNASGVTQGVYLAQGQCSMQTGADSDQTNNLPTSR